LDAVEDLRQLAKEVWTLLLERTLCLRKYKTQKIFPAQKVQFVLLSEAECQCAAGVTPDLFCGIRRGFVSMKPAKRKTKNTLQ